MSPRRKVARLLDLGLKSVESFLSDLVFETIDNILNVTSENPSLPNEDREKRRRELVDSAVTALRNLLSKLASEIAHIVISKVRCLNYSLSDHDLKRFESLQYLDSLLRAIERFKCRANRNIKFMNRLSLEMQEVVNFVEAIVIPSLNVRTVHEKLPNSKNGYLIAGFGRWQQRSDPADKSFRSPISISSNESLDSWSWIG